MFNNSTAFTPVKTLAGSSMLKQQYGYAFDLQKFQADWDRAHHSFSFDTEQMQNAVKQALNSKEVKRLMSLNQNIKQADIERMIADELYIAAEKNFRTLLNQAPKVFSAAHGQSLYFADSVMNSEIKLRNGRTRKPVKDRTNSTENTTTPDSKTTYAYGYGYDMIAANEAKAKNTPGAAGKLNTPDKQVSQPRTPGYTYHVISTESCPVISSAPKQRTFTKESIRLEYKNGIIVINDKEIKLAETEKVLARVSPRLKKISVAEQQLINAHIND
jgi:hypothetical protein